MSFEASSNETDSVLMNSQKINSILRNELKGALTKLNSRNSQCFDSAAKGNKRNDHNQTLFTGHDNTQTRQGKSMVNKQNQLY
jgi:hypothetical protein